METNTNSALGVSDEWMKSASDNLKKDMAIYDTVSDTLIATAKRIKMTEFDQKEDEVSISDYEKKLLLTGMQLTELAIKR